MIDETWLSSVESTKYASTDPHHPGQLVVPQPDFSRLVRHHRFWPLTAVSPWPAKGAIIAVAHQALTAPRSISTPARQGRASKRTSTRDRYRCRLARLRISRRFHRCRASRYGIGDCQSAVTKLKVFGQPSACETPSVFSLQAAKDRIIMPMGQATSAN